jgi:hypothetical protein
MSHRKLESSYGWAALICLATAIRLAVRIASEPSPAYLSALGLLLAVAAVVCAAVWRHRRRARIEAEILAEAFDRQQRLAVECDPIAEQRMDAADVAMLRRRATFRR